eukprot:superscaffoldBa00004245_g18524
MDFRRVGFGMEDEDDEDDAATQYMIEQSLLEINKQKETHRDSTTRDSRSSGPDTADSSTIFTAIRQAIRSDRADLVKMLLLQGSRVNQLGHHGRCPLHEAAQLGKAPMVNMLLQAGAQPDPRSHYGLTPLALASQAGHLEVVETLLRRGERGGMFL